MKSIEIHLADYDTQGRIRLPFLFLAAYCCRPALGAACYGHVSRGQWAIHYRRSLYPDHTPFGSACYRAYPAVVTFVQRPTTGDPHGFWRALRWLLILAQIALLCRAAQQVWWNCLRIGIALVVAGISWRCCGCRSTLPAALCFVLTSQINRGTFCRCCTQMLINMRATFQ
ncbi:DUF2919 family protein [Enterobacter cloacae subsp. cloacae]|nr:DUF2919 family protein [Enterobacter cloacae subsp. cloacae]